MHRKEVTVEGGSPRDIDPRPAVTCSACQKSWNCKERLFSTRVDISDASIPKVSSKSL